jgi:hypothetical protein
MTNKEKIKETINMIASHLNEYALEVYNSNDLNKVANLELLLRDKALTLCANNLQDAIDWAQACPNIGYYIKRSVEECAQYDFETIVVGAQYKYFYEKLADNRGRLETLISLTKMLNQ